MDKEAFLAGFVKASSDLNLNNDQMQSLFHYAMNYPPMFEQFKKMAEGEEIDPEDLDTFINLQNIKRAQAEFKR